MQRFVAACMAAIACASIMTGCGTKEYQGGTYQAEFASFDSRGYKDYMVAVVEEGTVRVLEFDGIDADGNLKSEDEAYAAAMEAVQNNYPARVNATLVTQYLAAQDIDKVDVVAGATYSTESFVALFKALEDNLYAGDEALVIVDNIPEK